MEDFYTNITSLNNSYDYSNFTYDYSNVTSDYEYYTKVVFIWFVLTCVIIGVGLFLTLIAIYCLYSQVRKDHVAPIYVINLLISDIIQLCCFIIEVTRTTDWLTVTISNLFYDFAVGVSVGFMVFIALERYLVFACPLWYRFRRTIKIPVVVCVLVWTLALVTVLVVFFCAHFRVSIIIFCVVFLLPLPLFIFFLVGTLKALSGSISVPSDEKRRVVGVLVLVLLIYTMLFLPRIIFEALLVKGYNHTLEILYILSWIGFTLSPLADLTLYVFMRKGIIDKLLSSVCCCTMDSDDTNSPSV